MTQVVPAVDGNSSAILKYRTALAKYFPGEAPDYVSLEGYVDGTLLLKALKRAGPRGTQLDDHGHHQPIDCSKLAPPASAAESSERRVPFLSREAGFQLGWSTLSYLLNGQ